MDFRRINPADVPAVQAFAIEGLRPHCYPMRLDVDKIRGTIEFFAASHHAFHLAAFHEGRIVGGIAAVVQESAFFERCDATVVMCRATKPGVGRALLSALMTWVDRDMRIRRVFLPLEFDARPSMQRLARRYGFTRTQTVCAFEKD